MADTSELRADEASATPRAFRTKFGDFHFAPPSPLRCLECAKKGGGRRRILRRMARHDEEGSEKDTLFQVQDVEINAFPFFNLPKDIRDYICDLWVQQYLCCPTDGVRIFLHGCLCSSDSEHSRYFDGPYQQTIPVFAGYKDTAFKKHRHRTTAEYEFLRSLSNTSCKLREEFGAKFWMKTTIDATGTVDWTNSLTAFLTGRSRVAAGVKQILIDLEWNRWETLEEDKYEKHFDYLATTLDLNSITLGIETTRTIARQMVARQGNIPWMTALRKIRVKQIVLELTFKRGQDGGSVDEDNGEEDDDTEDDLEDSDEADFGEDYDDYYEYNDGSYYGDYNSEAGFEDEDMEASQNREGDDSVYQSAQEEHNEGRHAMDQLTDGLNTLDFNNGDTDEGDSEQEREEEASEDSEDEESELGSDDDADDEDIEPCEDEKLRRELESQIRALLLTPIATVDPTPEEAYLEARAKDITEASKPKEE